MEFVSTLFAAVVRTVFKLVLLAAALVFILSLLCVALVSVTWILLKALLTGRKPAFVTTFTRFRQASQQFRSGEWPARGGAGFGRAAPDDVMDVQAHEVRNDQALPYGPSQDKP
ncbi:hypothetical protein [Rhodoferax saidenbachensis]|uniref:Uncharacterized protein n=1 Tax=Rhodoferax saidenbachensis TaxID=1484693 RepID=A0A1P8K6D0_9BURK|nr:hypothetical protein [Rhodoferax saidenbachensis]APW41536.1 hypothetical protein RS694_02520 [Rhodoferax saidenbachensis]